MDTGKLSRLVAERVMGDTLDWGHTELLAIIETPESRSSNNGRGIFVACAGCTIRGAGNEIEGALRQGCPTPACAHYATDLQSAMMLIQRMEHNGWAVTIGDDAVRKGWRFAWVVCFSQRGWEDSKLVLSLMALATARSIPLAATIAALRAHGLNVEDSMYS
jgi:hypothetical protein